MKTLRDKEALEYIEKYPCRSDGSIELEYELCDEDKNNKDLDNHCTITEAKEWIESGECDDSIFYVSGVLEYEELKRLILKMCKEQMVNYGGFVQLDSEEYDGYWINGDFANECAKKLLNEELLIMDTYEEYYTIAPSLLTPIEKVQSLISHSKRRKFPDNEYLHSILLSLEKDIENGNVMQKAPD